LEVGGLETEKLKAQREKRGCKILSAPSNRLPQTSNLKPVSAKGACLLNLFFHLFRYLHDPPCNLLAFANIKIPANYSETPLGKQLDAVRVQLPFKGQALLAD